MMPAAAPALGALFGLGLMLLRLGFAPPRPSLTSDLAALRPRVGPATLLAPAVRHERWSDRLGRSVLPFFGDRLRPLESDLRLLGRSFERHAAEKVTLAVVGLCLPAVTSGALALGGAKVSIPVPVVGSLFLATLGFVAPDRGVRSDAKSRRRDARYGLASFFDLVTINLAGGAGVESAMADAARVGTGWVFRQLRRALEAARLGGEAAWKELGRLGAEADLPDLKDFAGRLALTGTEGARVRASLEAMATTMHTDLLADMEADADSATEHMGHPMNLMGLGFVIYVAFPALYSVFNL